MFRAALLLVLSGCSTWSPPEPYDGQYTGQLTVVRVPQAKVVEMCRELIEGVTEKQKGCAVWRGNSCHVVIIDRIYRGSRPIDVLRHELGHCNGWPADHPE